MTGGLDIEPSSTLLSVTDDATSEDEASSEGLKSDEGTTLPDESGMLICEVAVVVMLSSLGIDAEVSKLLLSYNTELDPCVELISTGLDVISCSRLLWIVDESRSEDEGSAGGPESKEEGVDVWKSMLLSSVFSAPWEEYDSDDSSEGNSEIVDCTGFWDDNVKESDCDTVPLPDSSTCDSWDKVVDCGSVSWIEVTELCCSSDVGIAESDEVGSLSRLVWL